MTGMGEVTPIGDSAALAEAIIRVIQNADEYRKPRRLIADTFSLERTVKGYEVLFESLIPGQVQSRQAIQAHETTSAERE